MSPGAKPEFPPGTSDERELLLGWLSFLREAAIRDLEGLDEAQARWRPDGALICVLGVVNHLTHVEWRWIDGGLLGEEVSRSEQEFTPGPELDVPTAIAAYRERAARTDATIRALPSLSAPCTWDDEIDARWIVLHLLNETARHTGHADATRELLDGTRGE